MLHLSRTLLDRIARRHGIVRRQELIDERTSGNTIRRLVSEGTLVSVHRGVYRWAVHPDTFESRCAATCLTAPDLIVTGAAAARLWGFRHVQRVAVPTVLTGHGRSGLGGSVVLRRTNVLAEVDIVDRSDGIRVASPPRAWFDCAVDVENDEAFEALTEWVLDHHSSMPTLWSTVRRLDRSGRPGLGRVKRVLSQRPTWQKPADSRLELRVVRALERAGIGPIVRQHSVVLPSGVRVHLDGALPDVRWGVEVDHVTWHGGRLDAQADKQRDRQLRQIGWQIERVGDRELRDDFRGTIRSLARLARARRREAA